MPSRPVIRIRRALTILSVLALAAVAWYGWRFVHHEPTRLALARRFLATDPSAPPPRFSIDGLRWPTLHQISADGVRLHNPDGTWLEARGVSARFALRPLLGRTVRINELHVNALAVNNLPAASESRTDRTPSAWRFVLPVIRAEHLHTDALATGTALIASDVEAEVDATALHGHLRLQARHLTALEETVGLRGDLSWADRAVSVTNLTLTTRAGSITGVVHSGSGRTVLALYGTKLDLAPLAERFNDATRGGLDAAATLTHTPGNLGITWSATGSDLERGAVRIPRLHSTGEIHRTRDAWVVHEGRLSADSITLGSSTLQATTAHLRHEGNRLLIDATTAATAPVTFNLSARAGLSVTGDITTITLEHATGHIHGADATLTRPATLRLNGGRWSLDTLALAWRSATLTTKATWNGELNWSGQLNNLPFEELPVRGLRGNAKASWELRDFPGHANGQAILHLEDATTGIERIDAWLSGDFKATARIRSDRIQIEAQSHGATNLSVLAHATMPCTWHARTPWFTRTGGVHGSALVHAELKPLLTPYLAEWQQVSGQLKASLGLSGDPANPAITGNLVIANGFIEDVVRGASVRDLSAKATIASRDHIHWTATARDDSRGHASLDGTAIRNADGEMVLRAEAVVSQFILGRLLGNDLPINGKLALHGTGDVARLDGQLAVAPITVRLPRQLPPSIRTMRVVERGVDAPTSPAPERPRRDMPLRIITDIKLSTPEAIRVNGRQLRSEWRGRGLISGVIPDLRLGGSITLQRGSFMFLGRRFQVLRGEVIIPSGTRTATPTVFITAETRASGATITLNVAGSADDPQLTLSSVPPLERNEIVARLLFGKSGDAVSPFQIAFLAHALDVLDGGGPLLQQIDRGERTLGLDQLDIKQSEESSGLQAVVFGKRLLDRLYFEGEIGLEREPDVFAVEAELTPNLILRTETSPRIREGISIQWRRDY
jgi:translocation and assembly module TamB